MRDLTMSRTNRAIALGLVFYALVLLGTGTIPSDVRAGGVVDWSIDLNSSDPGEPLPTALLGHYDLSGDFLTYD